MAGIRTFTRPGPFAGVATPLAPDAKIDPPFADPVPDKDTPDVHSQPWNDFFTKQADRVADVTTRMATAETNITNNYNAIQVLETQVNGLQTQINTVNSTLNSLQTQINTINTRLATAGIP